jgi:chorismate mutase/prephenate dehydratase
MDLPEIRRQIDRIDKEILDRLNERIRLAVDVGRIKRQEGLDVYVPSREEEILDKLSAACSGPLTGKALRAIYREIISAATALQKPLQIAYLGPEATYTHQAALKNFGSAHTFLALNAVPDVFTAVRRGDADYGVVPIENSTQGTVISSLDMLVESELTIVAQIQLEIAQCLISHAPLTGIRSVHSKDNALGQCRQWLARMLPGVELVEATSTAAAVLHAAGDRTAAAIAGSIAAQLYDVPIVCANIMDRTDNVTRFLVIGNHPTPPMGGGRDKTSIVFSLRDEPGALLKILLAFSSRGINLCKIESRPSRKRAWDYYFYVDIVGHREDPDLSAALAEISKSCPFYRWLGSYPNAV